MDELISNIVYACQLLEYTFETSGENALFAGNVDVAAVYANDLSNLACIQSAMGMARCDIARGSQIMVNLNATIANATNNFRDVPDGAKFQEHILSGLGQLHGHLQQ